ncbi:MAG TPA: DUF58 domain-containing protein [Chloroflexaceae bacterium]|mgnify:CR=1 FL=1|nr:DUF58 domain-containing protein [Chloroflexaceae bacterium]
MLRLAFGRQPSQPMANLRLLTLLILAVAAALRSEIFFYLLYVLVGLQLASWAWVRLASRSLRWSRRLPAAAFPGEPVEVTLLVRNEGLLPIPWLALHESLPPALRTPPSVRHVLALGAREERAFAYTLQSRRRGLYEVGPLLLRTGDALGLHERPLAGGATDQLVVYPQVLPLAELGLPAALPFGARPAPGSLFTDPARPLGVRPYQPGDGVRRVDWKSTARAGALQVRRHEPAIARETLVALAFSRAEYPGRFLFDELERAVVAAASIAADLAGRGQPVGLCTTGHDPLGPGPAATVMPAAGRPHLMLILRLLGRLEAPPAGDIAAALDRAAAGVGWGSTVVLVAAGGGPALVERLLPLRRRGLHLALVLVEGTADDIALAHRHHIACYLVDRAGTPTPA